MKILKSLLILAILLLGTQSLTAPTKATASTLTLKKIDVTGQTAVDMFDYYAARGQRVSISFAIFDTTKIVKGKIKHGGFEFPWERALFEIDGEYGWWVKNPDTYCNEYTREFITSLASVAMFRFIEG